LLLSLWNLRVRKMSSKQSVIESLSLLQDDLTNIARIIQTTQAVLVPPSVFGQEVDGVVQLWAERVEKEVAKFGVGDEVRAKYRDGLRKLHTLANKRNKRTSHQRAIKELQADFHADLMQPVMFHGGADPSEAIKQIIAGIPYPDQKGYLEEALRCIESDCKRAAAVLGWSAAMHHIHSKIEEIGFDQFNKKADEMSKLTKGRFKGFKASASIESISDLREVPDRRILWVLDGMGIIESNQRQRLEYGLDMRIQASHPGDAEVTLTNLESFFSDLSTLVFKNLNLTV
jgi:hypothetical protein